MKLSRVGFKLQRAVAKRGLMRTISAAPAKSGLIAAEEPKDSHLRRSTHSPGCYATSPSLFAQATARLRIDHQRFTFIDLGAGEGRVMLLASQWPFKQVLGVELSPDLQRIANRNAALFESPERRCDDVRCILSDVRDFVFPSGPLVIFLSHPFAGPVFENVMQNLADSLEQDPREVYVVYLKPEFEEMVARIPSMKKLWEANLTMAEEDSAEACAGYATRA